MKLRREIGFLLAVLLALIPMVVAAAEPPATAPADPIPAALERLKSPDFLARAKAGMLLWWQGPAAIAPLTQVAQGRDPKLAEWAEDILLLLKSTDKTPVTPELLAMGKRYLARPVEDRKEALERFPAEDKGALPVLLALLRLEDSLTLRQQLLERIRPLAGDALMAALYRVEASPMTRGWIAQSFRGNDPAAGSRMLAQCGDDPEAWIRRATAAHCSVRTRADAANWLQIYQKEISDFGRIELAHQAAYSLPRLVGSLIADGRLDAAEALLTDGALHGDSGGTLLSDWAAFLLLTGKLDAVLAKLEQAGEAPRARNNSMAQEQANARARAEERLREVKANQSAVQAATPRARHPTSENAPLWEKRIGEIRASLAQRLEQRQGNTGSYDLAEEALSRAELAMCLRMAGDEESRTKEIAAIRAIAASPALSQDDRWNPIKALLLTGELDAALGVEAAMGRAEQLHKLLKACGRFREADESVRKLADRADGVEGSDLVFLADRLLEAGDRKRAEQLVRRAAELPLPQDVYQLYPCTKLVPLLKKLVGVEKALEYARSLDEHWQPTPEGSDPHWQRIHAASRFYEAGLKEFALGILDEMVERAEVMPGLWDEIVSAEFQAGLTDRAYAHADQWAAEEVKAGNTGFVDSASGVLAAEDSEGDWSWKFREEIWRGIRLAHAGEPLSAWFRACRDLRQTDAKERAAAVRREAALADRIADPCNRGRWLEALGDVCFTGPRDVAMEQWNKALRLAPSQTFCMQEAQAFASRQQWPDAAKWFERAWRFSEERGATDDPVGDMENDAVALYKWGWTLRKAGREDEGRKKTASAELMLLAQQEQRRKLAKWLDLMSDHEAAARQRDFILTVCLTAEDKDLYSEGDRIGEYLECRNWAAAQRTAASILAALARTNSNWKEDESYANVPPLLDLIRAHELLVGGDVAQAMEIIRRHQKADPENDYVTEIVMPELIALGHNGSAVAPLSAEADEVFRRHFDAAEEACRRSLVRADNKTSLLARTSEQDGKAHNKLAWYCAVWARELDTALAHAERAVALLPEDSSPLDTLAEVHFQRGEFKEAREVFKKCVEAHPWTERAAMRLHDLSKPDEELKKSVGPWPLSRAWDW